MVSSAEQLASPAAYLRKALALAASRRGFCAPNPAVGAIVCQSGVIVGEGCHHVAGTDHAEVVALKQAGAKARGATLYVTLEPCGHTGRTPPCVDAVLKFGIAELYYAYADPNPVVQQRDGLARLRAAGVRCHHVPLPEVNAFYQSYRFHTQHKRPWLTTKLAVSLDGKVAGPGGAPVSITADAAKQYTHECRYFADAILTSARTVMADDPLLNVRFKDGEYAKKLAVIDTHAQLPLSAKCLKAAASVTLYHADAPARRLAQLTDAGVQCVQVALKPEGIDLAAVMTHMGSYAHDVWVEAGPRLQHALCAQGLVATHLRYVAPRFLGPEGFSAEVPDGEGLPEPLASQWWPLGPDMCCQMAYVNVPDVLSLEEKMGYHWGLSMAQEIGFDEASVGR